MKTNNLPRLYNGNGVWPRRKKLTVTEDFEEFMQHVLQFVPKKELPLLISSYRLSDPVLKILSEQLKGERKGGKE